MNRTIPFNSPAPEFCPVGQSVVPLFEDNFEGSPAGRWMTRSLQGTGIWIVPDTGWSKSGTRMAWGEDFDTVGDAVLEMATGFTLPSNARLHFNHAYAFEEEPGVAYDGGVIEYSADGGTWIDAGNLIVGGDTYDPTVPITSSSGNPLGGRRGFVGNSYGYTASQLGLSSLIGRNVRFRFRVGTDQAVGNIGWVVDDVRLYSCQSQNCSYSVSPASISITADGGSGSVQVTATSANCDWLAASPVSWIRLSSTRGTGSSVVSFAVDANTATAPRSAALTIAGRTVVVSQVGVQPCTYSVTPMSASYPSEGGAGAVQVTASGQSCSWQASSAASWISLSRSIGTGTTTVSYTVAANSSTAARSANLTVAGKIVAIFQAAPAPPDSPRGGELRTSDSVDRLNWTYEPNIVDTGYVEFRICKVPAITWWKEFVVRSGNVILANFGVKDGPKGSISCASKQVTVTSLQRGFQMELWKAKFLGIPFQVKVMAANYLGDLRPGSRLTVTWLKD